VTSLEFLATATPAGFIRADLAHAPGSAWRVTSVCLGFLRNSGAHGLGRDRWLDAKNSMHYVVLNVVEERLEHSEPFGLINDEGIALAIRL
jgi:hypothetical protein